MKKGINKLLLMMSFSVFPIALIGCDSFNSPVSYKFHYYVNGDNGKLISDYKHEPNECRAYCRYGCPDNAYNFDKYGKKNTSCSSLFTAVPDEGYQVYNWTHNGKVVENNQSNEYLAEVSYADDYVGIISVTFAKIV